MKQFRWISIGLSAACMGLGLCLVVWPAISLRLFCKLLGVLALVVGLVRLANYFMLPGVAGPVRFNLASGLVSLLSGGILLFKPDVVLSALPLLLGVFVLIECVFKVQEALEYKRAGGQYWWVLGLMSVVGLVLGTIMIFMPFKSIAIVTVLLGVVLLVGGGNQLYLAITSARLFR
ncbi:MAG: DUF308 domain-containing protein [Clostridia bacterium]